MAQRRMGIIALLLCVCLCLMPSRALAVSTADALEPVSEERECSLTLSYTCNGTAFSGVTVKLYQIAELSAAARYTLTEPFAASGLLLNGIQSVGEWNVVRTTLESYLLANGIRENRSAVTDGRGQVTFEGLKPGLYLAVAGRAVQDGLSCSFKSALVSLPGLDEDGRWQYRVTVASKSEVTPPPGPGPGPGPGPEPDPDPEDKIQWKVLKLWKGDSGQSDRPQHIEVEIFRDGVSDQTVILSEENNWSYSWTAKDDGADWMVVERNVPAGYTVMVEERAAAFVLTNTYCPDVPPEEPPPPDVPPAEEPPLEPPPEEDFPEEDPPKDSPPSDAPKTGDTPHILLYTALMYASGIVLILLGITGKRKRV